METHSILVNANDEAIMTMKYSADSDATVVAAGCSLLSEAYLNAYLADHTELDTVSDVLADLGITDLREDYYGT